jgi:hypothetical protein
VQIAPNGETTNPNGRPFGSLTSVIAKHWGVDEAVAETIAEHLEEVMSNRAELRSATEAFLYSSHPGALIAPLRQRNYYERFALARTFTCAGLDGTLELECHQPQMTVVDWCADVRPKRVDTPWHDVAVDRLPAVLGLRWSASDVVVWFSVDDLVALDWVRSFATADDAAAFRASFARHAPECPSRDELNAPDSRATVVKAHPLGLPSPSTWLDDMLAEVGELRSADHSRADLGAALAEAYAPVLGTLDRLRGVLLNRYAIVRRMPLDTVIEEGPLRGSPHVEVTTQDGRVRAVASIADGRLAERRLVFDPVKGWMRHELTRAQMATLAEQLREDGSAARALFE